MSKVNRNDPKRSRASESRTSLMEFEQMFPDDAACLDYLVKTLYPKGIYCPTCERTTKHHRDKSRPSYACQYCGHHEHPMVGTIFQDSATSLKLWFYAMVEHRRDAHGSGLIPVLPLVCQLVIHGAVTRVIDALENFPNHRSFLQIPTP